VASIEGPHISIAIDAGAGKGAAAGMDL